MADELIIATADLGLGAASAKVSIFTCDVNGARVSGYVGNQVLVESVSTSTGTDGTITIPLAPTASISPANVFYKVTVGNYSKVITKAAGSQTLAAAVAPVPPAPLGSALELAGLADGPSDVPAEGDVLTWDTATDRSEWAPPSGGGGQVDEVQGDGVIAVDATDPAAPIVSFTGVAADIPYDPDDAAFVNGADVQAALDSAEQSLQGFNTNVNNEAAARAEADALLIPLTQRAANDGVATLDGDGLVPAAQIPFGTEPGEVAGGDDRRLGIGQRLSPNARGVADLIGTAVEGTTTATVVVVGDSYPELGVLSTVTSRLQREFNTVEGSVWRSINSIFGFTTQAGTNSTHGLGGYSKIMTPGQVCSHTFTCDAIDVYYRPGAGSIEVRDVTAGTLLTTINTAAGGRWQSGALTYGTRLISLTCITANVEPYGVMSHAGTRTSGVQVHGPGHTGWSAAAMNNPANADGTIAHIALTQPQVVFYVMGVNDYPNGIVAFEADTAQAISSIRTAAPAATVVMVIQPAVLMRPDWASFVAALYRVAHLHDALVVDGFDLIGTFGEFPGEDPRNLTDDGTHLNNRGMAILDAEVWDVVFGGFVRSTTPVPQTLRVAASPGGAGMIVAPSGASTLLLLTTAFGAVEVGNLLPASAGTSAVNLTQAQTLDAALVPKALVDAKGDLIVATAADTVARLAVGAEGTTLVANSNATPGVAWARWGFSLIRSGMYTSAGGATTTVTTNANRLYVQPFILHRRTTFDRIAINHTATLGGAGSVARLGIYASGTDDVPAARILDAGTVATDTAAAFKTITISQALDPGLYWLGAVSQWLTTNPVFTAMSLTAGTSIRLADDGTTSTGGCYFQNGVTGTLPNPMVPAAPPVSSGPLIYLRAA